MRCMTTAASWSYPVAKKIPTLGWVDVGVWVFKHSAVGNNIRPGSCLLPALAPFSALAPGFHMMLHRINTGGSKSINCSTGKVFLTESWLDAAQAGT